MDVGRKDRGNYIWGMLMSWKIQQRYLNNRFRDDPAITAVLVQHMLFQDQDEIVKKQLAKIDATAAQLEAHKQKTNSEVQKLKNEIAKLKEELGKTKK
jgi:septal ring factor EnvC (AmiA/AmiB activator)